jgi:hypothetical protein
VAGVLPVDLHVLSALWATTRVNRRVAQNFSKHIA